MATFTVDPFAIVTGMSHARSAQQQLSDLGTPLGEVAHAAPATGDSTCADRFGGFIVDRVADLRQYSIEHVNLVERLRLASDHYVYTESAIGELPTYQFDWTTL